MTDEDDAVIFSGHSSRLAEAAEVQRGQETLSGQSSKKGVPPMGGDEDDSTENEEDAPEKGEKGPIKGVTMSVLNQSGRQGGRGGIISLKMLIDDDILTPGKGVFSVDYKGNSYTASLLPDGRISFVVNEDEEEQLTFDSPSAFSVFVKRLTNPTRKADDGWKSVKYEGHLLEHYKAEFARKRLGDEITLDDALEPYTKRLRTNRFQTLHKPREVDRRQFTDTIPHIRRHASSQFAAIGPDDESNCQQIDQFNHGEQPFTLKVCPAAEIVMDFHSHLSMTGTIGLLGGRWDVGTKCLEVQRAFPIRELPASEECSHVEMDPDDKSLIVQEAANAGLKIVGWYHSHPTYSANPTTIDIYNQVIGQNAHQEAEKEGNDILISEPYVGAIICPFDVKRKKETSEIVWYFVEHSAGSVPSNGQRPEEVECYAKSFDPEQVLNPLYGLENLASMQRELEHLSKRYAQYTYRTELDAWWSEGVSVAEKMVASLISRLPSNIGQHKIDKFAEKVLFSTRAVWNVYGSAMPPVKDSSTEVDAATKSFDKLPGKTASPTVENNEIVPNGEDRADELISDVDEETEEE